ncbi:MAG: hypothetical protein GQ470_03380 [Gammaproteobacteria bacterium]|nr:hypothetical protein [Gammaproteobacteria bacterium]
MGTGCALSDTVCLQAEQELVDSIILQRRNGSATSLGGNDRLRGYPQGRFNGGHMAFIGTEYRWNFVRESKEPLDLFVWKDIPTTLQLAFFVEAGTVSENSQQLWDDYRTSYGIGGRILSASGSVYRADLAMSDEGNEVIVFFYYPWK